MMSFAEPPAADSHFAAGAELAAGFRLSLRR
jgi:hypothetical protein